MKSSTLPLKLSHLDQQGAARMVDVADKPIQHRVAVAEARLTCQPATIRALKAEALKKGDALCVARIAGIQAAKQTPQLIPLCHPLPLNKVSVEFRTGRDFIRILCEVATDAKTGVEMEALTGASLAALALYDMMKAIDKTMVIEGLRVVKKEKR
ncbi:MAG: cyclic pyranopterin monophosphate synthase MoaC [Terrimicrobiaceae bacterium]|nr:cyclic pyranopterin monophosphate synthase MoaC [Terrimicrobiaceae bacterium]